MPESSGRAWFIQGLPAAIRPGSSATAGVISIAQARSGGSDSLRLTSELRRERSAGARLLDGGGEVGRLGGEGAGEGVEVDDQALEVRLVAAEGAEGAAGAGDEAGEVVRFGAEQGVGDLGGVAAGVAAVAEGAVERLPRALALHLGQLVVVFGRRRPVGEGRAVALEQAAEVGPHRRLQGGQHFVDLHPGRGVADRDRVAAAQLGGAGAARREVDEKVALEEDARADRGEGVVVDRPALAFDGEGDLGRVAVAFAAITRPTSTPAIRTGELVEMLTPFERSRLACSRGW